MLTTAYALLLTQTGTVGMGPKAPELIGTEWINTKAPITLAERKGKVTLVHYWTYACYNCLNNLPPVARLTAKFKDKDVITIGIHTPEIEIEKKIENVREQVKKLKIDYPVLFDGEGKNWNRWKQSYWPTLYVIDKQGRVRGQWQGEMNYKGASGEKDAADLVEKLLAEK